MILIVLYIPWFQARIDRIDVHTQDSIVGRQWLIDLFVFTYIGLGSDRSGLEDLYETFLLYAPLHLGAYEKETPMHLVDWTLLLCQPGDDWPSST
jgi:hypothetical protein